MTDWFRHLPKLLRGLFLALLVLGVTMKPLLASFCDIHVLGDVVAGLIDHLGNAAVHEHANDEDHARGAHDTLHQGSNSAVYADIVPVIVLPAGRYGSERMPPAVPEPVVPQHAAGPFRPPIA